MPVIPRLISKMSVAGISPILEFSLGQEALTITVPEELFDDADPARVQVAAAGEENVIQSNSSLTRSGKANSSQPLDVNLSFRADGSLNHVLRDY